MNDILKTNSGVVKFSLVAVLCLFAALSLVQIFVRLATHAPENPWDAALVVEASRLAKGMALYEDPFQGHATWMYGPLYFFLMYPVNTLFGPSNTAPEVLSVLSISVIFAVFFIGIKKHLSLFWSFICLLSFICIELKAPFVATARPDLFGLMCISCYLCVCCDKSLKSMLYSTSFLMMATMSKQNFGAFGAVPMIYMLISGAQWSKYRIFFAILPGFFVALFAILLITFNKEFAMYFWEVPSSYSISINKALKFVTFFVATNVFLWAALSANIIVGSGVSTSLIHLQRLLFSVFLVALPISASSYAKWGGANNSALPVLFVMLALAWTLAAPVLKEVNDNNEVQRAVSIAFLTSILLSFSFEYYSFKRIIQGGHASNVSYNQMIEDIRGYEGDVISPCDPTVTLHALGQHDRSYVLDLDVFGWPDKLPDEILDKFYSTDWIIVSENCFEDYFYTERRLRLLDRGYYVSSNVDGFTIFHSDN